MQQKLAKLSLIALFLGVTGAISASESSNAEGIAFFEKKIRPVLIESCYECHSTEGKRKGGLLLDNRAAVLAGGDSGAALVPGKPEESLLMLALSHTDRDLEMPPKKRLPESVIADFKAWIALGAPDPREGEFVAVPEKEKMDIEAGREFWSFKPVVSSKPPAVKNTSWPRGDIDKFLLAKLEENKLSPADDVPPEALLRRVYYDLTGLPPSVEDIDTFLSNPSQKAFEAIVDKLLASPEFGERWGRHWLDIVRYADSSGGGRAIPHPDAWRFRDYVIKSFQQDKPLDELIREHLAGDLLEHVSPEEEAEHLTATGFLAMGPTNYELQDKELLDLEIVDEQLDTMGRAFLGMTIGCARCHDHKFDPISIEDYYAMAGIFTSTQTVNHSNVSKWVTTNLPSAPGKDELMAKNKAEVAALESKLKDLSEKLKLAGGGSSSSPSGSSVDPAKLVGIVVDDENAEVVGEWQKSVSTPKWVAAGYTHDLNTAKGKKSVTFRPRLKKAGTYEVRVSYSIGTNRSAKVPVTVSHKGGESTKRINQKVRPSIDNLFVSIGSFAFNAGDESFVRISNEGCDDGFVIVDAVQFIPEGNIEVVKAEPKAEERKEGELSEKELKALRAEIDRVKKQISEVKKRAPKMPVVMSVKESAKPADTPVRIRGVVRNEGEIVPRGVLSVTVPPGKEKFTLKSGSGRLELAEWVTDPSNPLTSRVMANRIWLHLFGEGIVRSVDNFGKTGELPSHPQLLDYLASQLMKGGWSTKELVREIVLSRAYALDSVSDESISEKDPRNTYLSKAHRRRLDAEAIRDTMLLMGGQLDRAAGGPSLPSGFRSEFGHKFKTRKRSVYAPVFRNSPYEVLQVFDVANPNFVMGKRPNSNIPTQALFMLNSGFVADAAESAAKELLELPATDDSARIALAFRRVLGRPPSDVERQISLELLETERKAGADSIQQWITLHQGLFACVDFRYLR